MKKRIVSLLFAAVLLVTTVGAQSPQAPRWTYLRAVFQGVELTDQGLEWSADADAYFSSQVTDVEVVCSLQVQGGTGWGTLDTLTDKQSGYFAGSQRVYTDWLPAHSYRIKTYVYIYNGDTVIETAGPLYSYCNT